MGITLSNDEQTYNYHTQADNKDEDKTVLHNKCSTEWRQSTH